MFGFYSGAGAYYNCFLSPFPFCTQFLQIGYKGDFTNTSHKVQKFYLKKSHLYSVTSLRHAVHNIWVCHESKFCRFFIYLLYNFRKGWILLSEFLHHWKCWLSLGPHYRECMLESIDLNCYYLFLNDETTNAKKVNELQIAIGGQTQHSNQIRTPRIILYFVCDDRNCVWKMRKAINNVKRSIDSKFLQYAANARKNYFQWLSDDKAKKSWTKPHCSRKITIN